jgi:transposase
MPFEWGRPHHHRVREQLVGQRTTLLNALRGHLSEVGIIAPQGAQYVYELKQFAESGVDGNGESSHPL